MASSPSGSQAGSLSRYTPYVWLLPSLIFLFVMAGSLGPGSYFLHFDAATSSLEAADLLRGCWGTSSHKPGIALLLAVPYALGGVNPVWDMVVLSILGAAGFAALTRLAASLTGSVRWAVLGALWFLSLPVVLYYTRIHLGFPLAFFIVGLLLHNERRFFMAGLAFGLTYTAHLSFLIPIGAWIGWSAIFHKGSGRVRAYARLVAGILIPILVVEIQRFLFHGDLLGWNRDVFRDIFRQSGSAGGTTWWHIWAIVRTSNGWLNALLLLSGLAYPLVRRPRVPLMDAVYLAGWSVVGLYTGRVALTHTILLPRLLGGVYPLLALSTLFTLMRLWNRLLPSRQVIRRVAFAGIVALALPFSIIQSTLQVTVASRTAYAVVDRVMADAAQRDLPVRYFGNMWVGMFYGLLRHVEVVTNESSLDVLTQDHLSVLIFENPPGGLHPTLAALRADPRFDPTQYKVETYPHLSEYRPRDGESYLSTSDFRSLRRIPLTPDVERSTLEVWIPRDPEGAFEARSLVDPEVPAYILHYSGTGCSTPRHYGYGTKNYYDLLFEKALEILTGSG